MKSGHGSHGNFQVSLVKNPLERYGLDKKLFDSFLLSLIIIVSIITCRHMKSSLKYRREQHGLRLSTARVGTVLALSRTSWNELSAKVKFLLFCEFSICHTSNHRTFVDNIHSVVNNKSLPSKFVCQVSNEKTASF